MTPHAAPSQKILVYGYGNPGREDDGLGPLCIESLERSGEPWGTEVEFHSHYQLNIEDALLISEKDVVIFVDAAREGRDAFFFKEVEPASRLSFFTHGLAAEDVLGLSLHLFKKRPRTYLLGIKGYEWGIGEGLTANARDNLRQALSFLRGKLKSTME